MRIDSKTTVPLSFVAGLLSAVVPAAFWVQSVISRADVFDRRVAALEQTAVDVNVIRQDVAVMKAQIDFLVQVQGRP